VATSEQAAHPEFPTVYEGGFALRCLWERSERLILALYVVPHCETCARARLALETLVGEHPGQACLVVIDIDAEFSFVLRSGVYRVPTVQLIRSQKVLSTLVGLREGSQYREVIARNLADCTPE